MQGPGENRLKLAANQVLEKIRDVEGAAEPNSSDEGQIPHIDVNVDRQQAWAAGVGIADIARTHVPAAMRRMRGGRGGGKPDKPASKPPQPRAPQPRPTAPEPVAAMHLHMIKESGKD